VGLVRLPKKLMILADRGIAPEKDPSVAGCGDKVAERLGTDVGILAKLPEGRVLGREGFDEQPAEALSYTRDHGDDLGLARCPLRSRGGVMPRHRPSYPYSAARCQTLGRGDHQRRGSPSPHQPHQTLPTGPDSWDVLFRQTLYQGIQDNPTPVLQNDL